MNILTIVPIAIALAMDCFAVSIAGGATIKHLKINDALKIAIVFGLFQAIMPIIGWLAGLSLTTFISNIDHWIAFGLLTFIGCKMIYESRKIKTDKKKLKILNIRILLLLAVATSIDALAVGLSFAFLKIQILTAVIIIGIVAFLFSLIGLFIGNKIGHFFEKKIGIIGGIILIAIGIRILLEHLQF